MSERPITGEGFSQYLGEQKLMGTRCKSCGALHLPPRPLCPACRGFENRFSKAAARDAFDRRVVLFPLDNTCNWMVDSAVHPGACAVSGAGGVPLVQSARGPFSVGL